MNPYLLPVLEHGPAVIERILRQIEPARWDDALEEGRFTPREAVAHLADWEPILLQRVITAVESSGADIEAYDEGERAIENRYAEKDPFLEARAFAVERKRSADYIRQLADDDWDKTVRHPERGVLTVQDLCQMFVGHDLYHIEHLSQYLGEKTAGTW